MHRKILLSIAIDVMLLQWAGVSAQESFSAKKKFEIKASYTIQRPIYSVTSPFDFIVFGKDNRFRNAINMGARYYPFEKSYAEYQLSYSQEGGGYKEQFTNANYMKNSLFWGHSSDHSRRLIFEIYTGVEMNIFLNARFRNAGNSEMDNVNSYFNKLNVSVPIGIGLKTKISGKTFLSLSTFFSVNVNNSIHSDNLDVYQVIVPSLKIGISKFIH